MLINHPTEKENRSPSPKKHLQQKLHQKDTTLINCPRNQDGKIKLIDENDRIVQNSPRKGKIDQTQVNRMKAKLADREFEVKKLEEDFAQYRLLSKLEQEKALKKLKEELNTTKTRHNQEIKKWEGHYVEVVKKYEDQREQFRKTTQQYFSDQKDKYLSAIKDQHQTQVNQLLQSLKNEKEANERALMKARQEFEEKMSKIQKSHESEKQQIVVIHQAELKKTEQMCQSKILMIECQKNAETKLVEQTKHQTTKNQEKYLFQIGKLERERKQLSETLDNIDMKVKVLQNRLDNQNKEISRMKQQHDSEIQSKNKEIISLKSECQKKLESEKLQVMKEHYEKTNSLELKLIQLEQLREAMINELKNNQRTLDLRFEKRESKKEDIEALKQFGFKLAEKEKEAHYLYSHLKMIQLQKDNNDKIYTRIFTANKERRGSSHRADRDIYSILKQSNTVDLRHMLKINHKDSKK